MNIPPNACTVCEINRVQCTPSEYCAVVCQGIVPLPSYFSSEWSFAQFKPPEDSTVSVGFGPQPNTLLVATHAGSFYKVSFDPLRGGPCIQQSYCVFFNAD